jgi:hypothetical protein
MQKEVVDKTQYEWSNRIPDSEGLYFYAFLNNGVQIDFIPVQVFKGATSLMAGWAGGAETGVEVKSMKSGLWSEPIAYPKRISVSDFKSRMGDPNQEYRDKSGSDKDEFIDWAKSML